MILKKPYAFLIKHFKIIHLLLSIPLLYLVIKTGAITSFFTSYINANYVTNLINIAGTYINYVMYFAIIIVLLITLAIYFLMRQKEKSTLFYFFLLSYYIALFILITFLYSAMNSIESATLTAQAARLYRDISFIAYIPQYLFLGYTILRGIGFNLKQFAFEDDMRQLEISDVDNEEFEVNIGKDLYKYKRGFRRFLREFKYYFLENKFVFLSFIIIVVISSLTIVYLNFEVYHKTYHQQQNISHNGLVFQVVDSVLSNRDLGGNIISNDKYFLAVALKVNNRGTQSMVLDYQNFKIKKDNDYLVPTLDRGSYFIDLGIPYTRNTKINRNEEKTFVLTYEIDKKDIYKNLEMRILESLENTMTGITPVYKDVKLNYQVISDIKDVKTISLGKILLLSDTRIGLTQIQLSSYQITNAYTYTYQNCQSSKCQNLNGYVTVNPVTYGSNKMLLVVDRNFTIDKDTNYYVSRNSANSFVNDFLHVRYKLSDGTIKEAKVDSITPKELTDKWVLVVPSEISKAELIDLLVIIRGESYVMNLKTNES